MNLMPDGVELGEVRRVWFLGVGDVEEADATHVDDRTERLPLVRCLPTAGLERLPCGDDRLAVPVVPKYSIRREQTDYLGPTRLNLRTSGRPCLKRYLAP
jgi:hypothetical protein